MSEQIAELKSTVLQAFEKVIADARGAEAAELKTQAAVFAHAIAAVGQARLAGEIDDAQARALIAYHTKLAEASLAGDAGRIAGKARPLIVSALNGLVGVGLSAAGLGILTPVVQGVVTNLAAQGAPG